MTPCQHSLLPIVMAGEACLGGGLRASGGVLRATGDATACGGGV